MVSDYDTIIIIMETAEYCLKGLLETILMHIGAAVNLLYQEYETLSEFFYRGA